VVSLLPILLLLALTVKQDHTALRSGCESDAEVVATLDAGARLTIRYALSGESTPCYKVAAETGGKTVEGYLSAGAMEGLDDFEQGRRDAAWLDTPQIIKSIRSSAGLPSMSASATGASPKSTSETAQHVADQAGQLIERSQPVEALALLEPEIRKRKDPMLLALAGVAAWRADDSRGALEYLRGSLELQPNPDVQALYRRVERETKGDQSTDKIYGIRVVLRYENTSVPADTARQMVTALDDEFSRISGQLGCYAEDRIVAIVQSRDAYRKTTDAAEWSGGQYDGRIRVPVFDGQGMDARMRRVLAHEITHACLAMLGNWPAWFQEGLAQKLSGDVLSPQWRQKLGEMARLRMLPRLNNLGQDWSRLDTAHATAAYALSLAAVELFYENYSEYGIANLVRNPQKLAQITADLDQRLGL
jgi:hypothetical protein